MARRMMAVKSRRERQLRSLRPFLPPSMPYRSPPYLYCALCSQSLNSGTAAASTVNDYHDVHARCDAEGRPE